MSYLARSIKCFLAFAHMKHLCIQTLARTLSAHALKQRTSIGYQRDTANCPILCGRFGIAAHNNLASIKVHIAPCDLTGFTFPAAGECQSAQEVCAISGTPRARVFYLIDKLQELVTTWQRELLRAYWHAL